VKKDNCINPESSRLTPGTDDKDLKNGRFDDSIGATISAASTKTKDAEPAKKTVSQGVFHRVT